MKNWILRINYNYKVPEMGVFPLNVQFVPPEHSLI